MMFLDQNLLHMVAWEYLEGGDLQALSGIHWVMPPGIIRNSLGDASLQLP